MKRYSLLPCCFLVAMELALGTMRTWLHTTLFSTILLLVFATYAGAQTYLDLVNVQFITSPDQGLINREKNPATLRYYSVQTTIPVQLRNKKDVIILSPYFDQWIPKVEAQNDDFPDQYSVGLPVSFLKSFNDSKWSALITAIIRKNGYSIGDDNNWQIGTALIANYKARENLTYKAGIYLNKEFFGVFVMPLVGIDWQISKKTNLFGVLPGNLVLEHMLTRHFYAGGAFKAITTSFKTMSGFWRLDENRVGIFVDYYVFKNVVVSAEAGHSVLRQMRTGISDRNYKDWNVNDNAYLKLALAYRIRLR